MNRSDCSLSLSFGFGFAFFGAPAFAIRWPFANELSFEVIGEKYLAGQKEIEQLQEYVVAEIVALKAENNRLRLVLKDIYYRSNDAEVRNMAWDAAHDAPPAVDEQAFPHLHRSV